VMQRIGGPDTAPEESDLPELPALTEPFTVLAPSPSHWILIGSLLEDLRRVREVVVEAGEQH
jgi:hypothetical protein